jgi:spoIIIJ-associated protein
MGDEREFEGRDLEEALGAASAALSLPREKFEFRIMEEGRRGLFGLGAKRVRILVTVPDEAAPEPDEKPRIAPPERPSDPSAPAVVEDTVRRMLAMMGLELVARAEAAGDAVRVILDGADRHLLAQKDGELLNALQFLLNRMGRRAWPAVSHLVLECEGFQGRREEDLINLTREVARQVARTGRPKKLHSMNPYERRLVHITVREFPELTSRSAGDGFLKQITVARAGRGGEA